jgi:hypothetical protein
MERARSLGRQAFVGQLLRNLLRLRDHRHAIVLGTAGWTPKHSSQLLNGFQRRCPMHLRAEASELNDAPTLGLKRPPFNSPSPHTPSAIPFEIQKLAASATRSVTLPEHNEAQDEHPSPIRQVRQNTDHRTVLILRLGRSATRLLVRYQRGFLQNGFYVNFASPLAKPRELNFSDERPRLKQLCGRFPTTHFDKPRQHQLGRSAHVRTINQLSANVDPIVRRFRARPVTQGKAPKDWQQAARLPA